MWEGVGDRTELRHVDPHSYGHNSVTFLFSWAAQPEDWGPSLCWDMLLIPSSSLQLIGGSELQLLNRRSYGPPLLDAGSLYSISSPTDSNFLLPGLYNNLTPALLPASVTISHSIQPLDSQGHILIFLDLMHLLFTQVHFLFWQLGRGQYATLDVLCNSYLEGLLVHTFPICINLKVNATMRLELELASYDIAIQHISPTAQKLCQKIIWIWHKYLISYNCVQTNVHQQKNVIKKAMKH